MVLHRPQNFHLQQRVVDNFMMIDDIHDEALKCDVEKEKLMKWYKEVLYKPELHKPVVLSTPAHPHPATDILHSQKAKLSRY